MSDRPPHADVRLKERTRLSPEVLARLRQQLHRRRLPSGTHHVRLGTEGYAVLKDVGGRHVVATVLSRHMRPPGKEMTFSKVAQLPTAPGGVPGVPIPVVYRPGQSPQERAARASLPPLASGADPIREAYYRMWNPDKRLLKQTERRIWEHPANRAGQAAALRRAEK